MSVEITVAVEPYEDLGDIQLKVGLPGGIASFTESGDRSPSPRTAYELGDIVADFPAGVLARAVPVAVRDGVIGVAPWSDWRGVGNIPRDELRVDRPPEFSEAVLNAEIAVCDRSRRGAPGRDGVEGELSPVSDNSLGERRGWDCEDCDIVEFLLNKYRSKQQN